MDRTEVVEETPDTRRCVGGAKLGDYEKRNCSGWVRLVSRGVSGK